MEVEKLFGTWIMHETFIEQASSFSSVTPVIKMLCNTITTVEVYLGLDTVKQSQKHLCMCE